MKIESPVHTVIFGDRRISFNLQRNSRKRLKIVVTLELEVEVYAPRTATDDQVCAAVTQKGFWIIRKLEKQTAFPKERVGCVLRTKSIPRYQPFVPLFMICRHNHYRLWCMECTLPG
jgi:predicted metal-dependent hydrolase